MLFLFLLLFSFYRENEIYIFDVIIDEEFLIPKNVFRSLAINQSVCLCSLICRTYDAIGYNWFIKTSPPTSDNERPSISLSVSAECHTYHTSGQTMFR